MLRKPITALTACNGTVIDIERKAIMGDAGMEVDRIFYDLESSITDECDLQFMEIIKDMREEIAIITVNDEVGEVPLSSVRIGGNAVNCAIAIDTIERLFYGQSGVEIYGPLGQITEMLLRQRTRVKTRNSLSEGASKALPERISVVDSEAEKYIKFKPKYEDRINTDLQFLRECHSLIPPQSNGDLMISSCLNTSDFWSRVNNYIASSQGARLYFEPGSVHFGHLKGDTHYLPIHLLESRQMQIIMNASEVRRFEPNLQDHRVRHSEPTDFSLISYPNISITLPPEQAGVLAKYNIGSALVTNGPNPITQIDKTGAVKTVYIVQPVSRLKIDDELKILGLPFAPEVLSVGCGDTFTGAYIAFQRMFPDASPKHIIRLASYFSAIQTHNPNSNISNLELEKIKPKVVGMIQERELEVA